VEANKQALAALVTREIGKPAGEALGEVQEIIDTCDFFLGEGRRLYGQTVPSEMPDKQLFTFRVPVGVAAVITPATSRSRCRPGTLVPRAAVAGTPWLWKPAEYAAASARALAELAWRAGVPAGVLNLVFADGPATYDGLEQALASGVVDKVGFTGSSAVGARIGELCGRHLQSPCLELGWQEPDGGHPGRRAGPGRGGRACSPGTARPGSAVTSLGSVIVHADVHDEFVAGSTAALRVARIGDPTQDVLYGPLLDEKFADGFEKVLGWITTTTGRWARRRSVGSPPRRLGTASWVTRRPAVLPPVVLDGSATRR